MSKLLSTIVSYVFHPLMGTTYLYALLIFVFPEMVQTVSDDLKWRFLIAVFVMTFVVPGLSAMMLVKTGFAENLRMENLEDRRWPFIFTAFIYITVSVFFYKIFTADPYVVIIICFITFNMILLGITSFFWKISIHSSAMGGIVAFYIVSAYLTGNYHLYPFVILLPMAGLVMSARLALNSHNIWQVVAGFCVGLLTGLSSLLIIRHD